MAINYGFQNIDVAGMTASYFENAKQIAQLEFDATMKQNARLEQALTIENTSKLFGTMSEDVSADYDKLNSGLAKKLRTARETGVDFLTPMDWAEVNTAKRQITEKISKYNTFIDAYQKASEELISEPKKYHPRTSKDNLLSFSGNPLDYINSHKSPTFLTPAVTEFGDIISEYQKNYKKDTSFKDEQKIGTGKKRTVSFEGNVSMFNTDNKGKVLSMKDEKQQRLIAIDQLIGMAKGNAEYNRSMQTTYEDLKAVKPDLTDKFDAEAAALYPNDPIKQAYARGALTLLDTNVDFYRAKGVEDTGIVREPKARGGAGKGPKIIGTLPGQQTSYSATDYLTGKTESGIGLSQDVGKMRPINTAGKQGVNIKFVGQTIVDYAPGKRRVLGTSYTPSRMYFTDRTKALGFVARESVLGDLGTEGERITAVPKDVVVNGKKMIEVIYLQPTRNVKMDVEEFNRQSPDFQIGAQNTATTEWLKTRQSKQQGTSSRNNIAKQPQTKTSGGENKPVWLR